ncbi:MAG: hypothetical protein HN712_28325 [Gemmatimonadetes bacterium]|jgi:hypothetical protein|nr:hypothetical protein [Gemmatimonadota bacterium]MBT6147610.1 hypothetical protein [Gemmatimonadota bacterium]MBT7864251.1 hypothetical protein [Gemmatimonadota bacterium]
MPSADQHLQKLGPPAFKLWIFLCRLAAVEGAEELVLPMSELALASGVRSEEGGEGLGPVRAALRRLVSNRYVTAMPEKGRRCRLQLLQTVEVR